MPHNTAHLLENPDDLFLFRAHFAHKPFPFGHDIPKFSLQVLDSSHPGLPSPRVIPIELVEVDIGFLRNPNNPTPPVRVVFVPTYEPYHPFFDTFKSLYEFYNFPTAYLIEQIHGITHSFGSRSNDAWLHFRCKTLPWKPFPELYERHITGYHLSWSKAEDGQDKVVLVCSGGLVPDLSNRLGAFLAVPENVAAVLEDPYALWVPVLTDLWRFMDNKVESLNDKFKREEEFMISYPSMSHWHILTDVLDIYFLVRQMIYLKEGSEAILCTLENILRFHDGDKFPQTFKNLHYTRGLFQSSNLRLETIEKDANRKISQREFSRTLRASKLMKTKSLSMRMIAVVTVFFVPMAAVAILFSKLLTSSVVDFWMFWAVAVPVTAFMMSSTTYLLM